MLGLRLRPSPPITIVRGRSERSAARLAHQSGGLGVPSSNLGAPTNQIKDLEGHFRTAASPKSDGETPGKRGNVIPRWLSVHGSSKPRAGHLSPGASTTSERTVATDMAELGIQPHIIETVLNHRSGAEGASQASTTAPRCWRGADHVRSIVGHGERRSKSLHERY
jgi:hypothetical protein